MKITFTKSLYSSWYKIPLLILIVSPLIGILFSIITGKDFSIINILFPSVVNTFVIWGGSVLICSYVWKRYPWEKYPIKHIITELVLILLLLAVYISLMDVYYSYKENVSFVVGAKTHLLDIVFTVLITLLIVTIHEAVFFYQQWKLNFSKSIRLEKDNLEAKYDTLKAQVNPHFLFNSLNSLITMLGENPTAEKYVQNLSDYLRYTLVSDTKETVTLEEELENVKKYVYLQHSRFGDNFTVKYTVPTDVLHKHIPTLVLQMLIENCFVHNVVSKSKNLNINILADENNVSVENNFQKKSGTNTTGKGLKNIEGRYRFIENNAVKISNDEKTFKVTIPLI